MTSVVCTWLIPLKITLKLIANWKNISRSFYFSFYFTDEYFSYILKIYFDRDIPKIVRWFWVLQAWMGLQCSSNKMLYLEDINIARFFSRMEMTGGFLLFEKNYQINLTVYDIQNSCVQSFCCFIQVKMQFVIGTDEFLDSSRQESGELTFPLLEISVTNATWIHDTSKNNFVIKHRKTYK